ncbi:SDR family NAD(P)-dependent oxidoreductase [Bradyrhizobium liaoningense]
MSKVSPGRLADRRILITGAASGIGRATATLFAREGASLALLDTNEKAVGALADCLSARSVVADVSCEVEVRRAITAASEALGGLDGVANVAGISIHASVQDLTLDDWNSVIGVNLTGPFLICREALPFLKRNDMATIVNVSSGSALLPVRGAICAYIASKGGLIAFSKALAQEVGPKIRVNSVCPGAVDTPLLPERLRQTARDPSTSPYALQRIADAEEIANAILFLTSRESSYVTGSVLAVDGGRTYH